MFLIVKNMEYVRIKIMLIISNHKLFNTNYIFESIFNNFVILLYRINLKVYGFLVLSFVEEYIILFKCIIALTIVKSIKKC